MQKKLQVFISSTFTDLIEERQTAVEAVLNAGHIPAGMELFKSGDKSQKEVIKKWIDESDVYMLILGGRYGSIDEETGKSYTHWEYDYAGEIGKPRFAIVITDEAMEEKVREHGQDVLERINYQKYIEFKEQVLGKISKFYSDLKDIKIVVLESLKEFEKDENLNGWVSGANINNQQELLTSNLRLLEENASLKNKLEEALNKIQKSNEINGYSYDEIYKYLSFEKLELPEKLFPELVGKKVSLLKLFLAFKDRLAIGITNDVHMTDENNFYFFSVAPTLIALGLYEKVKVAGVTYQRIQTSKDGNKFLSLYELSKK